MGMRHTHTHTHPFNGPCYRDYPGEPVPDRQTNLDFTEARDSEWQWHQLGHMQICTSHQTITTPAPHHSIFYRPDALPATQPTVSKHWRPKTGIRHTLKIWLTQKVIIIVIIQQNFCYTTIITVKITCEELCEQRITLETCLLASAAVSSAPVQPKSASSLSWSMSNQKARMPVRQSNCQWSRSYTDNQLDEPL